jgi:thiol-disulfide isomerase/thioredoxin
MALSAMIVIWHTQAVGGPVKAPDFDVATLEGERYSRMTLHGRPALLIFWAPWCRVCQKELPILSEFVEREKPQTLRVLSIGFADSRANVEQFVTSHAGAFRFPAAYDEGNETARAYRVTATPTAVLVNERGEVVLVHRGGGLLQNVQFREFLSELKR